MTTVRRNSASDVDRTQPLMSNTRPPNESALARLNQSFFLTQPHPLPSRPNHYLDGENGIHRWLKIDPSSRLDTDVLTLRRQYDNMDLLDHGRLSNSAEDLSQLDRYSYPFDIFGQDLDDPEEGKRAKLDRSVHSGKALSRELRILNWKMRVLLGEHRSSVFSSRRG